MTIVKTPVFSIYGRLFFDFEKSSLKVVVVYTELTVFFFFFLVYSRLSVKTADIYSLGLFNSKIRNGSLSSANVTCVRALSILFPI